MIKCSTPGQSRGGAAELVTLCVCPSVFVAVDTGEEGVMLVNRAARLLPWPRAMLHVSCFPRRVNEAGGHAVGPAVMWSG